ncbi:MAG: hypothetical protein ABI835_13800 [Chloroflexota bacterium]
MFWKAHWRDISALALSPEANIVISGDIDGNVFQWSILTGEKLRVIRQPTRKGTGIGKIAFSPNGEKLALSWNKGLLEGQLEVYDAQTWELNFTVYDEEIFDFAWKPTGENLVSASTTLRVIDPVTGKIVLNLPKHHQSRVSCVAYTPDSKRLISVGDFYDPSLILLDAITFEEIAKVYEDELDKVWINNPYEILYISNDELVLNQDNDPVRWNFTTGRIKQEFKFPPLNNGRTWTTISLDGNLLAYAEVHGYENLPINWDELTVNRDEYWLRDRKASSATIKIYDRRIGQITHSFDGYKDDVRSLMFAPDSSFLLTGDWEGYIRIWKL